MNAEGSQPDPGESASFSKAHLGQRCKSGNAPQTLVRELSTKQLFSGQREILIEHNGAIYRLQITRSGKLILTK